MGTKIGICGLITFLLAPFSLAHEGHDHDAPTTLRAPKGGVIKALDEARVEVVSKGKDFMIYVYDKELKAAPLGDFKVVARAELPRAKKKEALGLVAKESFWKGSFDARGSHRYTLHIEVTHSKTGHTDNLTFTIEPRR